MEYQAGKPLKVRKDSHKIRKPQAAAAPHHRPPVVIYTVSPKVIHANPSEFMTLVQRLTGSSSDASSSSSSFPGNSTGAMSPEKKNPAGRDVNVDEFIDLSTRMGKTGILSAGPGALPSIPSNLFSSPTHQPNSMNFFHDLSPFLQGSKNFMKSTFMPTSASNVFNNFYDFN
ncbi:protein MKS1-like [Diospyros lotus]|uniref:protein MKS1-like n=1 Tax=Diospyros lotus TaxID=55363 RepID=UPI00224E9A21|nr:protein MKS1-like [Diospyros lotus]